MCPFPCSQLFCSGCKESLKGGLVPQSVALYSYDMNPKIKQRSIPDQFAAVSATATAAAHAHDSSSGSGGGGVNATTNNGNWVADVHARSRQFVRARVDTVDRGDAGAGHETFTLHLRGLLECVMTYVFGAVVGDNRTCIGREGGCRSNDGCTCRPVQQEYERLKQVNAGKCNRVQPTVTFPTGGHVNVLQNYKKM